MKKLPKDLSKGLEALNELEEEAKWCNHDGETLTKYDEERFNVIKQALTTKSKKEQAFEIIKENLERNNMKKIQKKYQKKLKSKLITFYLHEEELYNFACSINFQKFVKECLKERMVKDGKN
jgi:hypothetical protein